MCSPLPSRCYPTRTVNGGHTRKADLPCVRVPPDQTRAFTARGVLHFVSNDTNFPSYLALPRAVCGNCVVPDVLHPHPVCPRHRSLPPPQPRPRLVRPPRTNPGGGSLLHQGSPVSLEFAKVYAHVSPIPEIWRLSSGACGNGGGFVPGLFSARCTDEVHSASEASHITSGCTRYS